MTPGDLTAALEALGYGPHGGIGRPKLKRCPTCGAISNEREHVGLGVEEAARALGVVSSTLWRWLTGRTSIPAWVPLKLRELDEQLRARRVLAAALAAAPIATPQEAAHGETAPGNA